MSSSPRAGRSWSVFMCRGSVTAVLMVGFLLSGTHAQQPALPPEFGLIPPDAFLVGTFRVAELWNSEIGQKLQQLAGQKAQAEMEKNTGFGPGDVERVAAAFLFPEGINKGPQTGVAGHHDQGIRQSESPGARSTGIQAQGEELLHLGPAPFADTVSRRLYQPALTPLEDSLRARLGEAAKPPHAAAGMPHGAYPPPPSFLGSPP